MFVNRTIVVLSCFCVFWLSVVVCHGSVIYEFVAAGSGAILGELEFLDSVAKSTVGWTAPLGSSLSTLLEGGVGGFRWDFSLSGWGAGVSGDLVVGSVLGSLDGSELDFVTTAVGEVAMSSGAVLTSLVFTESWRDVVRFNWSDAGYEGDWVLQTPIPEPSTLVLFGIGMLGVLGYGFSRKRRKEK